MENIYEIKYNYKIILKFYKSLEFTRFIKLHSKRLLEIDELVEKERVYFTLDTTNIASLATSTAKKLQNNFNSFNLFNGDEAAYFFIKMVDPNFLFLEAYESVMNNNELIKTCELNFGFFDRYLILLEKYYNEKFKIFTPEDLWAKESLLRIRIEKKN